MNARELKHMAQLTEWKERVAACRGSGMSVRVWCQEHGIANKTYYYWEKEVLAEAGRQMAKTESGKEKRFVEMPALPERSAQADNDQAQEAKPALAAKLWIRGEALEIYAGADERMLEALVRILKDAE